MSQSGKLIEKLALAILGESRPMVVEVLLAFTQALLQKWDIPVDLYVEALMGKAQAQAALEELARRSNLN